MRTILTIMLVVIAPLPRTLLCQQTGMPPPAPVFSMRTSVVVVPALVRDKHGAPVFTLSSTDFTLTDDGVPQPLELEEDTGAEPLALVVVVETGGASAREFARLTSLAPMLESVIGAVPHRLAVVSFADAPVLVQPFTANAEQASAAVRQLVSDCSKHDRPDTCPALGRETSRADNQAAILDGVGFAVDLLRSQPVGFRRAILLVSETLDRGSQLSLDQAVRAISDTNTIVYAVAFSTSRSEAKHYAYHNLPIREGWGLSNKYPNPPHGCMGKDSDPDPDSAHSRLSRVYDCLVQLAPPLGLAKMAAIATADALQRNVPETVAHLTGGEYFRLTDSRSLESSLLAIANHIPNRYMLSFQPQSPHPGLHVISLRVPDYDNLDVVARQAYWADPDAQQGSVSGPR